MLIDPRQFCSSLTGSGPQCPCCGREMRHSSTGSGLSWHCSGRFLRGHPLIQWFSLDDSFQTKSPKVAQRLAERGYRIERAGNFYNIRG